MNRIIKTLCLCFVLVHNTPKSAFKVKFTQLVGSMALLTMCILVVRFHGNEPLQGHVDADKRCS